MIVGKFRSENSEEERTAHSAELKKKHKDVIPVVFTCDATKLDLKKDRFLIPKTYTTAQLRMMIRRRIGTTDPDRSIKAEEAIFIFVEMPSGHPTMLPSNTLMTQLAKTCTLSDGFIYMTIQKENTFG